MGMAQSTPLREYLERTSQTAEAFAAMHGFSPWSVRHWARGDKMPRLQAQMRLAEATGGEVSPEKWLDASRNALAPALCTLCERRTDDPAVDSCTATDCPCSVKEAA